MAKHHDWARALYDQTAAIAFDLGSPRAEAFAMLGAAAMLDISPDHAIARRTLAQFGDGFLARSEEHTSELQSLMRISYAVFCLKKKIITTPQHHRRNI